MKFVLLRYRLTLLGKKDTLCLSEEMKDKYIAIIQKQINMKIIIWWREPEKTEKTLVEWFWRVQTRGFQSLGRIGGDRETGEDDDKDCVEEGFQSPMAELDRGGEG